LPNVGTTIWAALRAIAERSSRPGRNRPEPIRTQVVAQNASGSTGSKAEVAVINYSSSTLISILPAMHRRGHRLPSLHHAVALIVPGSARRSVRCSTRHEAASTMSFAVVCAVLRCFYIGSVMFSLPTGHTCSSARFRIRLCAAT